MLAWFIKRGYLYRRPLLRFYGYTAGYPMGYLIGCIIGPGLFLGMYTYCS